MKTEEDHTLDILTKIREINQQKVIVVTESTVIDIYKKLIAKDEIDQSEIEAVKKRFFELCNYPNLVS